MAQKKKISFINLLILSILSIGVLASTQVIKNPLQLTIFASEFSVSVLSLHQATLQASTNNLTASLQPANINPSNTLTVTRDGGYAFHFTHKGSPYKNGAVEVSLKQANGLWTSWQLYKNGSTLLMTDGNGNLTIRFTDWPTLMIGTYTAKFRLPGSIVETGEVSVKVDPVNMNDYLNFNSGDYFIYVGCLNPETTNCTSDNQFTTRIDVGNQTTLTVNHGGTSKKITSNPLFFSLSPNALTSWAGGARDVTWFLSNSFDHYGNTDVKWALASVFYTRSGYMPYKTPTHAWVFLPKNSLFPPYFIANRYQDINPGLTNSYSLGYLGQFIPTNSQSLTFTATTLQNMGWKTRYRYLNVDFPSYKGPALQIRFWEYPGNNLEENVTYTMDEWYFVKDFGLIAMKNKIARGNMGPCKNDVDCRDESSTMVKPQYFIHLNEWHKFTDGESLRVTVSAPSAGLQATVNSNSTYTLSVRTQDGKPYTGYLTAQAYITLPGSQTVNYEESLFVDSARKPIMVKQGIAIVSTANMTTATFTAKFKPFTFTYSPEKISRGAARINWSNPITITVK